MTVMTVKDYLIKDSFNYHSCQAFLNTVRSYSIKHSLTWTKHSLTRMLSIA